MGNGNKNGQLLGAVLLGAAIGGVLGVLFAPAKGSETRNKLSKKGNDLTDAIKEKYGEIIDKFRHEMEDVKEQANELVANGKAVRDEIKGN